MEGKQFDQIVEQQINDIKELLLSKGDEYVRGTDRFHNFKKAAKMAGITPIQALKGFMLKHEVSLSDMINDIENGRTVAISKLNEKMGDIIVYNILLKGLMIEGIESNHSLQETVQELRTGRAVS
jgi:hypothetical protein